MSSATAFQRQLTALVRRLAAPAGDDLFNPYRDRHPDIDRADAAAVRRRNLRAYLDAFQDARWVLVGEAAGYNGCRFTGIPFTGEDLVVGDAPLPWTRGRSLARASRRARLSSEMSAKIVWGGIGERRDVVLWNAVPWHPHRAGELLSNRKPRRPEVERGLALLAPFLELFGRAEPVAVGRVAEASLRHMGHDPVYLRHPSMGGKSAFLAGLRRLRNGR